MGPLYELAVMGSASDEQIRELERLVSQIVHKFGLRLGHEIAWWIRPESFNPEQQRASAVVFFGGKDALQGNLSSLFRKAIPVLPIVSDPAKVHEELHPALQSLNCLAYNKEGMERIATALLECAGLLPRQRRIFLSYKRNEARQAALQLFDALSSRVFDVFLDTHGIAPADDFQAVLWHRLCDSDVLVMLDTPNYFVSRWTNAEFGRALAKGIGVLRIGWPGSTQSPRTATTSRVELATEEIDPATGKLGDDAIARICLQLETVRSQSHAVRNLNLVSNLRHAIESIGGRIEGVGPNRAVYIRLADDRKVVAYPTVGVPTSTTLHEAITNAPDQSVAVIYDHVGLHPNWVGHLQWLGTHIRTPRWVKASEAAWQFAGWET